MPLVTDEGVRGLIPWSYDGLIAAWEFLLRLERTPKDDWNLRPRSIKIVGDDGTVEEYDREGDLLSAPRAVLLV